MASTFTYRLARASWAIAIDITADSSFPPTIPGNAVNIKDRLWLAIVPNWLSKEEKQYLKIGLSLVADSILERKPTVGHILVRVLDVQFNPCHYQVEGLAAAIGGWAAREFAFGVVEIPIALDRERKRYIYRFRGSGAPLGILASGIKLARSLNWTIPVAGFPPTVVGSIDIPGVGTLGMSRIKPMRAEPPKLIGAPRQVSVQNPGPVPMRAVISTR